MGWLSGAYYFDARPLPAGHAPGLRVECEAAPRDWPRGNGRFASRGGDVCAWDGRLDNREDLLLQLGQDFPEGSSDSALALKLYQVRGIGGFRDLIGDWSLVIWDARSRTVVLASDYAGVRPLYYHHTLRGLTWSSRLSGLAEGMGSKILDEDYAASFLARGHAALRTPYRDVLPVPPGHAVCVAEDRTAIRAFWRLPVEQTIRYQDERRYEEQLRALFQEAVRVRLRADSPVCAELSGGLDSSSVTAAADDLAQSTGLVTFSYTYKDCPDERYFRAMERERNLNGVHFEVEKFPFVAADQAGDAAPGWWEPMYAELTRQMNRLGSAVLLTGRFGDFIMGNSPDDSDQVVDYLHQRQYLGAVREAFAWSQSLGVPVYPILRRALQTEYFSWTGSAFPGIPGGEGRHAGETSLTESARKRLAADPSSALGEPAWKAASPGRRRRFRALSDMLMARNLQVPETLQHISYAHPFAHRPLVEFMLTIPPAVVCRPGEPRRLMRRAFAGLLPPSVLQRRSKAAFGAVYRQALLPLAAEALRDTAGMRSVELGLIDRESVTARLQAFVNGLECNESQLRQVLLFEFWLRNRWDTGGRMTPPGRRVPIGMPDALTFQVAVST